MNEGFYGLYRATVKGVDDKHKKGRIQVQLANETVMEGKFWADPAFPQNAFVVPDVDDNVWVFFEEGDEAYPVWFMFWYGASDIPEESKVLPPRNKVLKTKAGHTIEIDDTEEAERIKVTLAPNADGEQHILLLDAADDKIELIHATGKMSLKIDKDGNSVLVTPKFVIDASDIDLGLNAAQRLILGELFMSLYNAHNHIDGMGAPTTVPVVPMQDAQLSDVSSTKKR